MSRSPRRHPGVSLPSGRPWRRALAPAAAILAAGTVLVLAQAPGADAAPQLTANWYESAPYYLTLDSGAPSLPKVMSATGEKAFDMAFILASGGSCAPSWDGTDPVSSDT